MQIDSNTGVTDAHIQVASLTAHRIQDDLNWGKGAIRPIASFSSPASQQALLQAVLQSIEPVADDELAYSACTDGRIPVALLNGEKVPVREQMVGADMVSAFFAAEVLGAHFYKNPEAPVAERVADVAAFLSENGLLPSSHLACGAAAGFGAIARNTVEFTADERFVARLRTLLPEAVYDGSIHRQIVAGMQTRLNSGAYQDLNVQVFLDAVESVSGRRAIAELHDDGRGVQGHVEECIIRLRLPGYAINEAKVAELTGGREVFGVNDNRLETLARLFGRGSDNDYRTAYLALELFADAGHGTLAKGLPTWAVTRE